MELIIYILFVLIAPFRSNLEFAYLVLPLTGSRDPFDL